MTRLGAAVAVTLGLILLGPAPASARLTAPAAGLPPGLPDGVPPAALRPEPELPAPQAWPFGEHGPRTSGTGRYAGGAFFWTDFLYDDNGAVGVPPPTNESLGAPSFGTYRYPEAPAARNGADLFRAAVGLTADDTWWRVDWNTLADPGLPIAAFAFDTDADPGTGVATWPAGAGLTSPGLETALVVSGTGAWLIDAVSGVPTPVADLGGEAVVDLAARSFLVRIPRTALDPSGTWTVRLAAGLADAEGDGFRPLDAAHGALPLQPPVYNVAFRDYVDEPSVNNFWFDNNQVAALTGGGDVSGFAGSVDWGRLAAGSTDPEPFVTGYSNRWYASSVELGQGITGDDPPGRDGEPNYLGRVQPYAVYVPTGYDPGDPAPLTWVLHSFTINHNQYGATAPSFLQQACEARGSICATTLGRGPDGDYRDVAELDFWEVWNRLAESFSLDPERTIVGGYSMGGFGTWRFSLNHPDLFAAVYIIASRPDDDQDRLENARWTPVYHAHGALDQLVPLPEALAEIAELDRLGYRYRFDLYPAEDHVAYALKDSFDDAAAFLAEGDRTRAVDPGRVTYRWFPAEVDADLGIGPDGAWWVSGIAARDGAADAQARINASSLADPDPTVTAERSQQFRPDASPSPAQRQELRWLLGAPPPAQPQIDLDLANVAALALDLPRAGLVAAPGSTVEVLTDGPTAVTVTGVAAGLVVTLDGAPVGTVGGDGRATVVVPEGPHTIGFAAPEAPGAAGQGGVGRGLPVGRLPATGGGGWPLAGAALLLLSFLARTTPLSGRQLAKNGGRSGPATSRSTDGSTSTGPSPPQTSNRTG